MKKALKAGKVTGPISPPLLQYHRNTNAYWIYAAVDDSEVCSGAIRRAGRDVTRLACYSFLRNVSRARMTALNVCRNTDSRQTLSGQPLSILNVNASPVAPSHRSSHTR
jgi:hypothetical protein